MIRINLLPAGKRAVESTMHQVLLGAGLAVLLIAVLFTLYSFAVLQYTEYKAEGVSAEIASLHVWQERYERDRLQNEDIKKRETLAQNMRKEDLNWHGILTELGNTAPFGMWLTNVSQGKNGQVEIKGKALQMEKVLEFVHRLQEDKMVARVDLMDIQAGKASDKTLTSAATMDFTLKIYKATGDKK